MPILTPEQLLFVDATTGCNTSYSQRRVPHFDPLENGYRYGVSAGSFHARTLRVSQLITPKYKSLNIESKYGRAFGVTGLALGDESNQVDICMWGVPTDAPVRAEGIRLGEPLNFERGTFPLNEGDADRMLVVPMYAGSLCLYLSASHI